MEGMVDAPLRGVLKETDPVTPERSREAARRDGFELRLGQPDGEHRADLNGATGG
jgi:hypothetical protein